MELQSFKTFDAINEASMGRVFQHTQGTNIGIISAHRGDAAPDVNKANHAELGHSIRKAGFGFIHVKGAYTEQDDKGNDRPVHEKSYMVIGKKGDDSGHLKGFLTKQGKKYNQDSVLHKSHDSEEAHLHGTNHTGYPGMDKSDSVGKFHPNRAPEYHSKMQGGRGKFAFLHDTANDRKNIGKKDADGKDIYAHDRDTVKGAPGAPGSSVKALKGVNEGTEITLHIHELRFTSPKGFFAREEVEF